jgi:hypothetical protein
MSAKSDWEQIAVLMASAGLFVAISKSARKVLISTLTRFGKHTIIIRYANRTCVAEARSDDVERIIADSTHLVRLPDPRSPLADASHSDQDKRGRHRSKGR